MPQCKGNGNWMVNSRVTPTLSKIKMDSSNIFTENKELDRRMRSSVETLTNKKLKMQAENKFRLMRAKYMEGNPISCTRNKSAGSQKKEGSADPHSARMLAAMALPKHDLLKKQDDSSKKITFQQDEILGKPKAGDSEGSEDEESDDDSLPASYRGPSSSRLLERPATVSGATLYDRMETQSPAPTESARPRSAFSTAFGNIKIRSFRSLKNLLNTDELTQSKYIVARETMLREKAAENAKQLAQLNRKIRHFYMDLDNFNRVTRGEEPIVRKKKKSEGSPFVFKN